MSAGSKSRAAQKPSKRARLTSKDWQPAEVALFLKQIRAVLPVTQYEWEKVADRFNDLNGSNWTLKQLRSKFNKLANARPSPGSHERPREVTEAMRLERDIETRSYEIDDNDEDDEDQPYLQYTQYNSKPAHPYNTSLTSSTSSSSSALSSSSASSAPSNRRSSVKESIIVE